jgi:hypothetical protein
MKKFNKTKKNNKKKGGNNYLTDDYFINPNFRKIILEPVFTTFNILFKNNTGKYEYLNNKRLFGLHFVQQYKNKKTQKNDFVFSPFFIYDDKLTDLNNKDYKDYDYITEAKQIIGSNDKDVYLIFLYENNIFKLDYISGIDTFKDMFEELTWDEWDEINVDDKKNIYAVIEINGEMNLK